MEIVETEVEGVVIIEPRVFGDSRGYFFESYNETFFKKHIGSVNFIQDNESRSTRGVLRGLHFQRPPFEQAKLVRCIIGEVLDVAVDIRIGSPTFGKHVAVLLSGDNKRQMYIPRGFAHGFVVLSEEAVFSYKVDNAYAPDYDSGIAYNDPFLSIDWILKDEQILLSDKDKRLKRLRDITAPFIYSELCAFTEG
ncbi:dTDP-4-dehydrorhamnose 3,5-epimerase [Alkaliflexus imshenetskii]|uniref:dTDP-4-dehydrorhamnose 3,5-epimerase n=1 Tax=Alkaliflexus imshenetskii TaxID=286730 RepID=UPI0004791516|nr:dTDP-4-dehydrorhamnose 3,5-epimerase [Alkaliflexus imshenetskii]